MSELITDYREAENTLHHLVERFRTHPLATTESYSFFELDDQASVEKREDQRRLFLSGELRNPVLIFPLLERAETEQELIEAETYMLELMRDSTGLAYDMDREAVLYDLLRVRRLEIGMLLLATNFCSLKFDPNRSAETANLYNLANDEINGPIELDRFNGLLKKQQERALKLLSDANTPPVVIEAAHYYLENTQEISRSNPVIEPIEVDAERFKELEEFVQAKFADLIELVPDKPKDEKFSAQEVADIFRKAHTVRGTGWDVKTHAGKSNIDTRQNEETTYVGTNKERTAKNTRGILVHENGVHVQRRVNGDKTGDPLLGGLGLPWYLASEEGITTILQQAVEGTIGESGEQYYLAIGLTRGFDGKPRDFRDAYELELRRRIMADYLKKDEGTDGSLDKQKSQAYATIVRVRRGTRAELPGVAYTKDSVYFLGNQKMWETMLSIVDLPAQERDAAFNLLMAAKYDPTNQLHLRIVKKRMS